MQANINRAVEKKCVCERERERERERGIKGGGRDKGRAKGKAEGEGGRRIGRTMRSYTHMHTSSAEGESTPNLAPVTCNVFQCVAMCCSVS